MHGFARLRGSRLEGVQNMSGVTLASLKLPAHQHDREHLPYNSRPMFNIALSDTSSLRLSLTNTDREPIVILQALHTYFNVSDIGAIRISGLDGNYFYDKVTNSHDHRQSGDIVFAGELDRIYTDSEGHIKLDDPGLKRTISINQQGSKSIVVWNLWVEKAGYLIDMGPPTSNRSVACIETGSVTDGASTLELAPRTPWKQPFQTKLLRLYASYP